MHFAVRPRRRLFSVLSAAALGMSSFSAAAVPVATNVVMHPTVSDYQFITATTPTEATARPSPDVLHAAGDPVGLQPWAALRHRASTGRA